LKRLRKQLLEATSTEEVEKLKAKMHIAEVDINYTQNCPLSEVYVSLYPLRDGDEEVSLDDSSRPKPPMWAEIERRMGEGTLNQLRNRVSTAPAVKKPKKLEKPKERVAKPAKPKPIPAAVDMTGMNRRQRRKQLGVTEPTKTKNKSIGFEKNAAFGAAEAAKLGSGYKREDNEGDEGGFFEE